MWKDPIVEEIRKLREEYAAEFDYDVEAIFHDLKDQERKSGREVVSLQRLERSLTDAIECVPPLAPLMSSRSGV